MQSSLGTPASQLLRTAAARISSSPHIEHWHASLARWDARALLVEVMGVDADSDVESAAVARHQARRFARLVERRVTGEPVTLITGHIEFCGLDLRVRPGVFFPRASSEVLVSEAVARLRRRRGDRVAVDVATGAGAVALAVAASTARCHAFGLDIAPAAVRLARYNARRLGVDNVSFAVSDLLSGLPARVRGQVDVLTIHPPYVARQEVRTLPAEVRRFEPVGTLTDGSRDGLGLVRRLAKEAPSWLRPGGHLLVEVAPYLARATASVLRQHGFAGVRSHRGGLALTRVVAGSTPR